MRLIPANHHSRPPKPLNRGEEVQVPTKVDVLIPTLKGLSSELVEHVRSRIPVHCILTSSVIGPARARQELMEQVDTDWFAFVDDDVRLRPDWWSTVSGMITPDVGGIEGLWSYLAADKRVDDYTRAMARLARLLRQESWRDRIDTFAVEKDLNIFRGVIQAYVQRNSGSPLYSLAQP